MANLTRKAVRDTVAKISAIREMDTLRGTPPSQEILATFTAKPDALHQGQSAGPSIPTGQQLALRQPSETFQLTASIAHAASHPKELSSVRGLKS